MGKKAAPDVGMLHGDEASTVAQWLLLPPLSLFMTAARGLLLHNAATWNANEGGHSRLLMRADPSDGEREGKRREKKGGEEKVNKLKKEKGERSETRIRRSSRNSDVPN